MDVGGLQEYLLYADSTTNRLQLLNSTTLTYEAEITGDPFSIPVGICINFWGDGYPRNGEFMIVVIEFEYSETETLVIYSMEEVEAGGAGLTIITLFSFLLFSQMQTQQSQTLILLGGVAASAAIISSVILFLRRGTVTPSP